MSLADDMIRAEAMERMQMAHELRVTFRSDEFKIKPWELRMLEDAYAEMLVERPAPAGKETT